VASVGVKGGSRNLIYPVEGEGAEFAPSIGGPAAREDLSKREYLAPAASVKSEEEEIHIYVATLKRVSL